MCYFHEFQLFYPFCYFLRVCGQTLGSHGGNPEGPNGQKRENVMILPVQNVVSNSVDLDRKSGRCRNSRSKQQGCDRNDKHGSENNSLKSSHFEKTVNLLLFATFCYFLVPRQKCKTGPGLRLVFSKTVKN